MNPVDTFATAALGLVRRYLTRAGWLDLGLYYRPDRTQLIPAGQAQVLPMTVDRPLLITAFGWDAFDPADLEARTADCTVTNLSVGTTSIYDLEINGGVIPRLRRGTRSGPDPSSVSELSYRGSRTYVSVAKNTRVRWSVTNEAAADRAVHVWLEGYTPRPGGLLARLRAQGEELVDPRDY